jgi:hypothetical protein
MKKEFNEEEEADDVEADNEIENGNLTPIYIFFSLWRQCSGIFN